MEIQDFSQIKRIHLVGIKGIAMAAFALWACEKGMNVTGSDTDEHFPSDALLYDKHIDVLSGFDASHISKDYPPDCVVYTGAHKGRANVEVQQAIKLGIPVLAHGQALGIAMNPYHQISVAGSHGKTSTSSMISTVLMHASYDPSYAIGCGEIRGLGAPGHAGNGELFVAEADEYITDPLHDKTPRFLWQHPEYLVVTNIDFDHPDAYENLEQVQDAFKSLQKKLTGKKVTIVNADDDKSCVLCTDIEGITVLTYGESELSHYRIRDILYREGETIFSLYVGGKKLGTITLHVPGLHNVSNAAACAVTCLAIGVPWSDIASGLSLFGGAKRRFEPLAAAHGIQYFDDYAHHPKEIQATLQAARGWFPSSRIIAVFQPHTYSRTKSLLSEFSLAFHDATIVVLADIYASARESDTLGVSGELVSEEIKKFHEKVYFSPKKDDVLKTLESIQKPGDVIIFMGAGDIYSWEPDIVKALIK